MKGTKKTCVPWLCSKEWMQVYSDIYSEIHETRRRGYEKLLVWKARCSQLPAGIECTIGLIQVALQEHVITVQIHTGKLPSYTEHDLKLMYSTAIMRFVNHIASLAQTSDETLYKMAVKLNIPDWLIALRHESAHGSDSFSLDVFRLGAQFALDWLNEHYWKESMPALNDWEISRDSQFANGKVKELIDTWQALKIYQVAGYKYVDELPDQNLRTFLKETDNHADEYQNVVSLDHEAVSSATNRILKKILRAIKAQRTGSKDICSVKLAGLLMKCDFFLPSVDLMKSIYGKEKNEDDFLPRCLIDIWNRLLIPLQRMYSVFPILVHELIMLISKEENDNQQHLIALWIKELCLSMQKSEEIANLLNISMPEKIKENTKPSVLKETANKKALKSVLKTVETECPILKNVFYVPVEEAFANICSIDDVRTAVLCPNKHTTVFLSSLLRVTRPELPVSAKQHLLSLLTIYANNDATCNTSNAENVHTAEELQASSNTMETENSPSCKKAEFGIISGSSWSSCAIGILPWQKDRVPELDLPSHVTWEQSESMKTTNKEINCQYLSRRKVNWDEIVYTHRSKAKILKRKKRQAKLLKRNAKLTFQAQ